MNPKHRETITIGFDAKRAVTNTTGLGSFSRTLINDLLKDSNDFDFILYAPDLGKDYLREQINKSDRLQIKTSNKNLKIFKDYWRSKGIVKDLIKDKVDIFHGLSGELPQGIRKSGIKSVVTIHDLIFLRHSEFYNPIDVKIYTHKFFSTINQADKIIAISECTKRDILHYSNVKEEKIDVIYQSYNKIYSAIVTNDKKQEIKQKYSLPDRFILNVGSIERRKNVLLAVKALSQLDKNIHLVIVGKKTDYLKEVESYVKQHSLNDRVHIYHNISNEELRVFYKLAEIFVYPSIYEGFGIPIIEAIANDLPVVACKGSCLEEAGGEYSYYVGTNDVVEMTQALKTLLDNEDKRTLAINESKKYIQRFANTNAVDKYFNVYNSLCN